MTRVWTLIVCALFAAAAQAADPPYYVKKTTWYDTLLASRDALAGQEKTVAVKTPLPDFGRSTFTIMAWVRTTAGGTILAKAPAKGKWAPQGKAFFIRDGKLCYDVGMVGCVTSKRSVADGKWHHVAVTRGDKLRLYIDGRLDVTGHLALRPDGRGHVPKIGYASTNFPQGFRGDLDEVRVYALKLSDARIQAHFEKPQPAKADGLVACWLFDTGGHDASGSGNDVVVDPQNLVAGKTGKAVRLNGRQSLRPPGDAADLRDALWTLVERDFRDETSRRQIAWEREDAILDADQCDGKSHAELGSDRGLEVGPAFGLCDGVPELLDEHRLAVVELLAHRVPRQAAPVDPNARTERQIVRRFASADRLHPPPPEFDPPFVPRRLESPQHVLQLRRLDRIIFHHSPRQRAPAEPPTIPAPGGM